LYLDSTSGHAYVNRQGACTPLAVTTHLSAEIRQLTVNAEVMMPLVLVALVGEYSLLIMPFILGAMMSEFHPKRRAPGNWFSSC
jgi:hypothetical protein